MSELTLCNYCSLKAIRRAAKREGKGRRTWTVAGKEGWAGWTLVKQTGREEPVAYFMALTDHCVC